MRPILARVSAVPGRLKGVIDIIGPNCIEGWACDDANPHLPVALEIFVGGEKFGDALACHYRADLAAAGLGRGYCMFSFSPGAAHGAINVRRVADGAEIFPGHGVRAAEG